MSTQLKETVANNPYLSSPDAYEIMHKSSTRSLVQTSRSKHGTIPRGAGRESRSQVIPFSRYSIHRPAIDRGYLDLTRLILNNFVSVLKR
ncbi:hypothetical protein VTL71DRAFT_5292 [Oculimacula yallundae]|uniref:Uncharacterized protein n=1 Tax=Oculimacula yallundae TaxID=86028 RepID=A0ABR4C0R4_9HELO